MPGSIIPFLKVDAPESVTSPILKVTAEPAVLLLKVKLVNFAVGVAAKFLKTPAPETVCAVVAATTAPPAIGVEANVIVFVEVNVPALAILPSIANCAVVRFLNSLVALIVTFPFI